MNDFRFCDLIAPLQAEEFATRYWEKEILYSPANTRRNFETLLCMDDVDRLLTFNNTQAVPPYSSAKNGPQVPNLLTNGASLRALDAFQNGATLLLGSLHQRWSPIAALCRIVEAELCHPVGATAVLSPKGAQGLSPHYDSADVFVIQLEGEKRWTIYDAIYELPLDGRPLAEVEIQGLPSRMIHLRPGDVLYVPRGLPHFAYTSEQHSFHLSLYINTVRWKDLLVQALLTASDNEIGFRQGLPVGILRQPDAAERLAAGIQERIRLLLANTDPHATVRRMISNVIGQMQAVPDGQFNDVARLSDVDLKTVLERKPGLCLITGTDTQAEIAFPGGALQGPSYLKAPFEYIAQLDRFVVEKLPMSSDKSKIVLAQRLIREGLLRYARSDSA